MCVFVCVCALLGSDITQTTHSSCAQTQNVLVSRFASFGFSCSERYRSVSVGTTGTAYLLIGWWMTFEPIMSEELGPVCVRVCVCVCACV